MDQLDRLKSALSDRYRVEEEIGRGGMATVYLAEDLKHKRSVAIKVMDPDLASMLGPERFLREIEIEAQLQHINILPLYDSGAEHGFLYYVMPYVEGESLRDRLNREQQLPLGDALNIAREVGDALGYAHEHGVVHRDVKPENILLSRGHALLTDFGIARAVGAAGGQRVTQSGHALGTPAYMSPEQSAGDSDLDGRSDLYSLACVLYEMLAGEPLFTARTAQALYAKHMLETPPPIRILRPAVPPEIEWAIEKALAKTATDRFATTAEFITAIHAPTGAGRERPSGLDEARTAVEAPVAGRREQRVGEAATLRPHGSAAVRRRLRRGLLAAAALVVVAGLYSLDRWLLDGGAGLDRSRIVVYPFAVSPRELLTVGEDVATLIGYAFERTGQLAWVDGWYALDEAQRSLGQPLSRRAARSKTRIQGAAFYVVGRVSLPGDSVRVRVELHDIEGDSIVATSAVAGPADEGWEERECGKAIEELVAALLPSQHRIESVPLSGRPQAVAAFLDGERAFRRAQFAEALESYEAAVDADTLFALAALKGARAALWAHKAPQARQMLGTALSRSELLTPFQAHFAQGLNHYVWGRADSALVHLRQAFAVAPEWWVLARIGEVYTHLLPKESPLDSLAEATFLEVRHHDPDFKPVLYHLIEIAVRKGEIRRAEGLLGQYRATDPDSSYLAVAELMLECVKTSPEQVDWRHAVLDNPSIVYDAAQSLAIAGLQLGCASAAWRAILAYEVATGSGGDHQFGALLGLQSALVAQGMYEEAKRLLKAAEPTFSEAIHDMYILNTIAGTDMRAEASPRVEDLRQRVGAGQYRTGMFPWLVGIWEVYEGRLEEAQTISDSLAALATRTDARRDKLFSRSLQARVTLLRGDTTRALTLLQELTPTKPYGSEPRPWESLPVEHLALAQLLYARGAYAEALDVAANFDAPARPYTDLPYLPASLSLRIRAARALGDTEMEERCRRRLIALGREDLLDPQ
jgi:tRNA A-37 threonylcarbamoyl transferase component Bud32/tetratricopeptide (TPR) repeat protein